jgi:hypothetical protein
MWNFSHCAFTMEGRHIRIEEPENRELSFTRREDAAV